MARAPRRASARLLRFWGGVLVVLAMLWSAAWAAGWWGANRLMDQAELLSSPSTECTERAVGGFPFNVSVGCRSARINEEMFGLSIDIGGLTTSVPLYYPLRVNADAEGPLALAMTDNGVRVAADWDRASTSVDAWPFGISGVRRFAARFEGLRLTAEGIDSVPVAGLTLGNGNLLLEPSSGDGMRLRVFAVGLDVERRGGEALPVIALDADVTAPGLGSTLTANPREQLFVWLANGGRLDVAEFMLGIGEVRVGFSGPLTLSHQGLLSGTVRLRLAGLDRLADLAEEFGVASRERVEQVVAVLAAFTRQADVDGTPMREVEARISNGLVTIGIIPVFSIPPAFPWAPTPS